jgi:menaquinone-dependent protoporphyrinogen oxidase
MARILILFATREGQTRRIAERMAEVLSRLGHAATLLDATTLSIAPDWSTIDGVIVGASIHYGRHPRALQRLVRRQRGALESRPSAFFSVSLSAGGPGANPDAARRYLEKFQRSTHWRPSQIAGFGGALQYSEYVTWKRLMMRLIVGMAGGDTDMSRDYQYTDWSEVERYAATFAQRVAAAASDPAGR